MKAQDCLLDIDTVLKTRILILTLRSVYLEF